ncbi:MAG: phage tail protein [Verrucomicrobiales bacterium]|nr:phage tail protein [Verrucomicrobiales bacterium]
MFGSTLKLPAPKPPPGGVDPNRFATNAGARPLPYLCGTRRLGVTFLSEAFGLFTSPVNVRTGKDSKTTVGYNYFASFAAAICHGPLDRLLRVWVDGELAWSGNLHRAGASFADLYISGRGNLRIYWGTETQPFDPLLRGSGQPHPTYRGQAYLVADRFLFGQDKTNAPNIEVEVSRFPSPAWLPTGTGVWGDDVNPTIPLYEWLTNPRFGLGLPDSRLDLDSFAAAASALYAEQIAISPLLTETAPLRDLLTRLLEYFDGVPVADAQGRLGLRLIRPGSPIVRVLTINQCTATPRIATTPWSDTANEVKVSFTDRAANYAADAVKVHDRANFEITGAVRSKDAARPWVCRADVARKIASVLARREGRPRRMLTLEVLRSAADGLRPGDLINFEWPQRSLQLLARVKSVSLPRFEERTAALELEEDVSWANAAWYQPASQGSVAGPTLPEPPAAPPATLMECPLPYLLRAYYTAWPEHAVAFFPAATKPAADARAWQPWLADDPMGRWFKRFEGRDFGPLSWFALRATLNAALPADTPLILEAPDLDFTLTGLENRLELEPDLEDAQINTLMLYTGGEWFSVFGLELVEEGRYRARAIRARWAAPRAAHAQGQNAWLLPLGLLDPDDPRRRQHLLWRYTPSGVWFKAQPTDPLETPLADIAPEPVGVLRLAERPLPPDNLSLNGQKYAATWPPTGSLTAAWTPTSPWTVAFPENPRIPRETTATAWRLEVWRADDSEAVLTEELPASVATFVFDASDMQTALGGHLPFRLKVWAVRHGLDSLQPATLNVQPA